MLADSSCTSLEHDGGRSCLQAKSCSMSAHAASTLLAAPYSPWCREPTAVIMPWQTGTLLLQCSVRPMIRAAGAPNQDDVRSPSWVQPLICKPSMSLQAHRSTPGSGSVPCQERRKGAKVMKTHPPSSAVLESEGHKRGCQIKVCMLTVLAPAPCLKRSSHLSPHFSRPPWAESLSAHCSQVQSQLWQSCSAIVLLHK